MKTLLHSFKVFRVNFFLFCFAMFTIAFGEHSYGQFARGSLVVDEVGDGKPKDTLSGSRVQLLQFTTTGTPLPSSGYFGFTGVPTTHPYNLVQSLDAADGFISLAEDNRYIAVPGYNDSEGTVDVTGSITSSSAAANGRTIGKLLPQGSLRTKATFNALSGGNYASVVTKDDAYWLSGHEGIVYTKTNVTNGIGSVTTLSTDRVRVLSIFNSTLFVSIDTGKKSSPQHGIWQVGTFKSLPTSGTPALVNIINTGEDAGAFAFEFSPSGLICYIAVDEPVRLGNTGGIQKWTYSGTFSKETGWSGGTWSLAYTLSTGTSVGARGLTVDFSGSTPIIYATTAERHPLGNRLISITDVGPSSTATTLATADNYYSFKGVAFAPFDNKNTPTITATTLSPNSVTTVYGTASSNMVFNVSGTNMVSGITVTPPAGFEVSLSAGSGFGSSVVAGSSGTIASTPIYVRLKATDAVGTYSGNIACTSAGATTQNVVIANSTVTAAPLTITADNETKCKGATFTFNGTEFSTSGLVNGDAVSSVTLVSSGAAASAGVGSYAIVPSAAIGTGISNYTITYANGTLTVGLLGITLTQINPDCNSTYGSLTSTITGGTAPYSYSLINAQTLVVTNSSNPLFSNLVADEYSYSAKDASGCSATAGGVTLAPLTQTPIIVTTPGNSLQVCYGGTATITTNVVGGNGPFNYSLNGGPFEASASRYFNVKASAGTYSITVKDNNGCTITTDPVTITQPAGAITFSAKGATGCVRAGNSITFSASGGYGNYSYSIDNGSSYQPTSLFTNLSYGYDTVTVKDENGCTARDTIVKLIALTSSDIIGNTSICPGGSTTINTVPSEGTPPYNYSLDNGEFVESSQRYFNVTAGTHTITVLDAGGCTYTPPSIVITTINCTGPQSMGHGLNNGGKGPEESTDGQSPALQIKDKAILASGFEAHLSPNPAPSAFHLQMESSSTDDIALIVTNMIGVKVFEAKGGIGSTYEFGANFPNGMYILQIMQGNTLHTIKLIKGK